MKVLQVSIKVYRVDNMNEYNELLSAMTLEDKALTNGGSQASNWICEMFGKLCRGLTYGNGADVCGRVF